MIVVEARSTHQKIPNKMHCEVVGFRCLVLIYCRLAQDYAWRWGTMPAVAGRLKQTQIYITIHGCLKRNLPNQVHSHSFLPVFSSYILDKMVRLLRFPGLLLVCNKIPL